MNIFIIITLVVLLLANVAVVVLLLKKRNTKDDSQANLLLQQQVQELTRTLNTRLAENSDQTNKSMMHQFSESSKLIREVTEKLTKVENTNKQVVSFAEGLSSLQDILKNPKQRGVLGEYYLESVLKNVLSPKQYEMQYKFKDGEIVDAVIFLDKNKILPIDSKFSLENYNRLLKENDPTERERIEKAFRQDLKNRIDETSKYIRPTENTMDFAFMFIPSEGIYYDLLVNKVGAVKASARDLIEYAFRDKKVIIVSPTSFMAYLQTVLQGLRALEIEEGAKEMRVQIEKLGRHLGAYNEYFGKLGNSLDTTVNHYNAAGKELKKVDKDVLRITGTSPELTQIAIEKSERLE